jgi:hypothetical protein
MQLWRLFVNSDQQNDACDQCEHVISYINKDREPIVKEHSSWSEYNQENNRIT